MSLPSGIQTWLTATITGCTVAACCSNYIIFFRILSTYRLHFHLSFSFIRPVTSFKISDTGFEQLQILIACDIDSYSISAPLSMSHFAEYPAIRAGDSLNTEIRTIDIPVFIRRKFAAHITVSGGNLAVCQKLRNPLRRRYEPALAMRRRAGICLLYTSRCV